MMTSESQGAHGRLAKGYPRSDPMGRSQMTETALKDLSRIPDHLSAKVGRNGQIHCQSFGTSNDILRQTGYSSRSESGVN